MYSSRKFSTKTGFPLYYYYYYVCCAYALKGTRLLHIVFRARFAITNIRDGGGRALVYLYIIYLIRGGPFNTFYAL